MLYMTLENSEMQGNISGFINIKIYTTTVKSLTFGENGFTGMSLRRIRTTAGVIDYSLFSASGDFFLRIELI